MEWIITANPSGKHGYKVLEAFEDLQYVDWHMSRPQKNIREGDIVYIYVGKPYSKIMLMTKCVKDNISKSEESLDDLKYYNDFDSFEHKDGSIFFRLKELARTDDERLNIATLNKKGYVKGNIQGSFKSDNNTELFKYIEQCFSVETIEKEYEDLTNEISDAGKKYTDVIVKARIGQGAYRDALIEKYDCKCMLCGIKMKSVLMASHIKEFAVSTKAESTDVNNGLLLCANHDKLFDQHLISFDSNGDIIISSQITDEQYADLGISALSNIEVDPAVEPYMRYHRKQLK